MGWLLTVALVSALGLAAWPAASSVLLVWLSITAIFLLIRLFVTNTRQNAGLLFGLLIPLIPGLGANLLLLVAISYLLIFKQADSKLIRNSWGFPFLMLLGAWTLGAILFWVDWDLVLVLLQQDPISTIKHSRKFLALTSPAWYAAILGFARLLVMLLLVERWWGSSRENVNIERGAVENGLRLGFVCSGLICLAQILGFRASFWANFGSFWQALGREPGTFTDPNAYGIALVLAIPLFFSRGFSWQTLAGLALLGLGLFSGSRSLVLGVLVIAGFVLLSRRHNLSRALYGIFALLVVINVGLLVLNSATLVSWLPPSLARLFQEISSGGLAQLILTRAQFARLGIAVWLDYPLFGAGYQQFRNLVPHYGQSLGLGIGLWTDNPNNYYLGILAECGIVGIIALMLCAFSLKLRSPRTIWTYTLLGFLIVLLTGPHLDFDEISILFAVILANSAVSRNSNGSVVYTAVAMLLSVAIVWQASNREHGFYTWEPDGQNMLRWTGKNAQAEAACIDHQLNLELRSLAPEKTGNAILATDSEAVSITLPDNAWRKVTAKCNGVSSEYRLSVDSTWIPGEKDPRMLGLQVRETN